MEPGASVAEIARSYGLNVNQLFKWRRAWDRGELMESAGSLLHVTLSSATEPDVISSEATVVVAEQQSSSPLIHIELPGGTIIRVERGADPEMVRLVLKSVSR
jgi:transposase